MAVGDSIHSLRQQLRRTEREMERQIRRMEELNRQMEQEQERKLSQLESEMTELMQRNERETSQRYQTLLMEYQTVLSGTLDTQMTQMKAEYQNLKREVEASRKEWETQTELLKQEVERQKLEEGKREAREKEEAREQIQSLEEQMQNMQMVPCEFFKQGRLEILREMVQTVASFFERGFHQSVIGLAFATKSDAGRLKLEVEEKMQEWETAFFSWKRAVESVERCFQEERRHAVSLLEGLTEAVSKEEHDWEKDLNYWSFGKWEKRKKQFLQHKEEILKIESQGLPVYLKTGKGLSVEELEARRKEVVQLFRGLTDEIVFYQNVYHAYQERILLGNAVAGKMEEEGFQCVFETFALKEEAEMSREWKEYIESYQLLIQPREEDYRGVYVIGFENAEGDLLSVSFTPIQEGREIIQQVHYCLELHGAFGGKQYQKDLLELLVKTVLQAEQTLKLSCALREGKDSKVQMEAVRESQKKIVKTIQEIKRVYQMCRDSK